MEESILTSTKKILGIDESYTAFDLDILTHINSAFATLAQIGIGPENGIYVEDDTLVWEALTGSDPLLNGVKTYVFLKVRLAFDPPGTSFHIGAVEKQIQELEWRLNVVYERTGWVDPLPDLDLVDDLVLDGGTP